MVETRSNRRIPEAYGVTIYLRGEPITADTLVAIVQSPDDAPPGFRSFLDVLDFKDIFVAWCKWRPGRVPTVEQAVRAIRHYDERDAFIPRDLEP